MDKPKIRKENKDFSIFRTIFCASVLCVGLYYEWACAISSIAMMCWLYAKGKKAPLQFKFNSATLVALSIFALYAISPIWAVDSGVAVWGIARFLPLPLFVICLMQLHKEERIALYYDLPYLGAIMCVVSFILQFVPKLTDVFSVSGRLAGFFEYPNTFACFLLLGIIALLFSDKQKEKWQRPALLGILSIGLLLPGSRAVFILAIVSIIASLIIIKSDFIKKALPIAGGVGIGVLVLLLRNNAAIQHVQEIGVNASTFLGRLLYWKDAFPVILRHPLGLGYLGYYFTQGSFQTGVYSVRFVHNDFLQLMLDIGWVPALLAIMAIIQSLWSKRVTIMQKVFLLTLLAHCCFDFDLSFIAMYFLVFLSLDLDEGKTRKCTTSKWALPFIAVFSCFSLYIGAVTTMSYSGNTSALRIYPWDTFSNMTLLTQVDDMETLRVLSDRVIQQNESVALAWDAKANAAYTEGDFSEMITCKRKAIELSKYSIEEYEDYFEKLRNGRELYLQNGDEVSAGICREEILNLQPMIAEVLANTDTLAWKINDKPELQLSYDYEQYVMLLS